MSRRVWLNLDHFRIPVKFGIITVMFLVAALVPTTFMVRSQNSDLARISREGQGVTFLKVLYRLADHAAQVVLEVRNQQEGAAKAEDNGPSLGNLTAAVDADLAALKAVEARFEGALGTQGPLATLAGQWAAVGKLEEPVAHLAALDAFLRQILDLNSRVVDTAGLSLDSDLTCTYLIGVCTVELPQVAVQALDLSLQAQQAVSGPGLTPEARSALQAQAGAIQGRLDNIRDDLSRGKGFSDPEVASRLEGLLTEHRQVSAAFLQRVGAGVLGALPTAGLPAVRFAGREAVLNAYGFQAAALKVLEDHLASRARANRWEQRLGLGGSLLSACLAFHLLASVYGGLRMGLEGMRASLEGLKQGDLTRTAVVPTQDEVGGLARDLNQSMVSLRTMVVTLQEAAKVIEAATQDMAGQGGLLAKRIASQSVSLDQTASSVLALATTATHTGTRAHHAYEGARRLDDHLKACQEESLKAAQAIGELEAYADQAARIKDGLDELAFQARLLAVDAVQMTADGELDRGFQRLATGVHGLGHRSVDSSEALKVLVRNYGALVQASGGQVAQATASVQQVAQELKEITAFVQEVTIATEEQASRINQISETLTSLGASTDDNVAQLRQAKTSADTLASQARSLTGLVEHFKV